MMQRVRSSLGALPLPQCVQLRAEVERTGLAQFAPPHSVHWVALAPDQLPPRHPSHSARALANSPAAHAGAGVWTSTESLTMRMTALRAATRIE